MRPFLIMIAAMLCMGLHAQSPQSLSIEAPRFDFESPTAWDDWVASLSPDELQRIARFEALHGRGLGGLSTHPTMTMHVLGLDYPPVLHLPIATFYRELEGYEDDVKMRLIEIFNIELISPNRHVDWPMSATLRMELSNNGRYVHFGVPMDMRGDGTYYVRHPQTLLSELIEGVSELGQYPKMQFSALEGFVLNEDTIDDMPLLGTPITFNFRFGDVRVDTGFQWAGRPKGPFNGGVEFLK